MSIYSKSINQVQQKIRNLKYRYIKDGTLFLKMKLNSSIRILFESVWTIVLRIKIILWTEN